MTYSRSITTPLAAVALAITLAGCGAPDATAPAAGMPANPVTVTKVPTTVLPRSRVYQIGIASSDVVFSPAVVVLDQGGVPMYDVEVHFAATTGGGSVAPDSVSTDAYGLATANWRLGDAGGEYTLEVAVSGITRVLFRAVAIVPSNSIRWDLQLVGGAHLPITYSGGGATWTLTGGHYVLVNDSTYAFGYEIDGVKRPIAIGRYIRIDSSHVQFYQPTGPYPASAPLSTGDILGDVMTVTYEDPVDFDVETYVAAPSPSIGGTPARAARLPTPVKLDSRTFTPSARSR